jgi:hypothetical protein
MCVLNVQTWTDETEDYGFAIVIWVAYLVALGLPAAGVSVFVGGIPIALSRLFSHASVVKAVAVGLCYFVVTMLVDVPLLLLAYESPFPPDGRAEESPAALVVIQSVAALSLIGTLIIDWSLQRPRVSPMRSGADISR